MAIRHGAAAPLLTAGKARQAVEQQTTGQPCAPIEQPLQKRHVEGQCAVVDGLGMLPHEAHTDAAYFSTSDEPSV